jgi:hypothetical protein
MRLVKDHGWFVKATVFASLGVIVNGCGKGDSDEATGGRAGSTSGGASSGVGGGGAGATGGKNGGVGGSSGTGAGGKAGAASGNGGAAGTAGGGAGTSSGGKAQAGSGGAGDAGADNAGAPGTGGNAGGPTGGAGGGSGGDAVGGSAGQDACPAAEPDDGEPCPDDGDRLSCSYGETLCYCRGLFGSDWDCEGCPPGGATEGEDCSGFEGMTCVSCDCPNEPNPEWFCGGGTGN